MPADIRNLVNWQNWSEVADISPRSKFHVCQNLDEISFPASRDAQLTIIAFGCMDKQLETVQFEFVNNSNNEG